MNQRVQRSHIRPDIRNSLYDNICHTSICHMSATNTAYCLNSPADNLLSYTIHYCTMSHSGVQRSTKVNLVQIIGVLLWCSCSERTQGWYPLLSRHLDVLLSVSALLAPFFAVTSEEWFAIKNWWPANMMYRQNEVKQLMWALTVKRCR